MEGRSENGRERRGTGWKKRRKVRREEGREEGKKEVEGGRKKKEGRSRQETSGS
jgi:hypothetical protein